MRAHDARALVELGLSTLLDFNDPDAVARIAPSVTRAASELGRAAPLGLLADLALVLGELPPRLDVGRARALATHVSREAYDALVAPLASNDRILLLRDALSRHPRDVRADAAGSLVAELIGRALDATIAQRAAPVHANPVTPAALRRALATAPEKIAAALTLPLAPDLEHELTASSELIARGARAIAPLVGPAEVLLAEGAPHLKNRAARIALRQLTDATAAIAEHVPATLRKRKRRGERAVRGKDAGTYPTGGLSSLTTSGSLESVVSSELAMSSPEADLLEDLFAVRWASGELLYWARDESIATRRRTAIWIRVPPELATERVVDAGAPWQRPVLALAAVAVFLARALFVLHRDAVTATVAFPARAGLDEDAALLAIVLGPLPAARTLTATQTEIVAMIERDEERSAVLDLELDLSGLPTSGSREEHLSAYAGIARRWLENL
ncbi:MAG: hypothetical protein U0271_20175 [Polyangiaceae bacterium]